MAWGMCGSLTASLESEQISFKNLPLNCHVIFGDVPNLKKEFKQMHADTHCSIIYIAQRLYNPYVHPQMNGFFNVISKYIGVLLSYEKK